MWFRDEMGMDPWLLSCDSGFQDVKEVLMVNMINGNI